MKRNLIKLAAFLAIIAITAAITWRVTILTLQIEVSEDTAYVTSFGQTDVYDYVPLWAVDKQ